MSMASTTASSLSLADSEIPDAHVPFGFLLGCRSNAYSIPRSLSTSSLPLLNSSTCQPQPHRRTPVLPPRQSQREREEQAREYLKQLDPSIISSSSQMDRKHQRASLQELLLVQQEEAHYERMMNERQDNSSHPIESDSTDWWEQQRERQEYRSFLGVAGNHAHIQRATSVQQLQQDEKTKKRQLEVLTRQRVNEIRAQLQQQQLMTKLKLKMKETSDKLARQSTNGGKNVAVHTLNQVVVKNWKHSRQQEMEEARAREQEQLVEKHRQVQEEKTENELLRKAKVAAKAKTKTESMRNYNIGGPSYLSALRIESNAELDRTDPTAEITEEHSPKMKAISDEDVPFARCLQQKQYELFLKCRSNIQGGGYTSKTRSIKRQADRKLNDPKLIVESTSNDAQKSQNHLLQDWKAILLAPSTAGAQ